MTKYRNNKSEKRKLKNYIYFYEKWKLVTKYRNKNKSDDLKPKNYFYSHEKLKLMTKYRNQKNRKTIIVSNNIKHPESNKLDLRYQGCITNFWYSLSKQHPHYWERKHGEEIGKHASNATHSSLSFFTSFLATLCTNDTGFWKQCFSFRAGILSTFFHRQLLIIQ